MDDFLYGFCFRIQNRIKESRKFPLFTGWGEGYAAFTYSRNDVETITNYIKNQQEHHRVITFTEEYRKFLIDNGINPDERYFLKD